MGLPLSMDLRKRIIESYEESQGVKTIVKNLRVCKTAVYDLIKLYKTTGQYAPYPRNPGRKSKLTREDIEKIKTTIAIQPDIELSVLKDELNLAVSIPALCNTINHKLNLPRKKNFTRKGTTTRRCES